VNNDAEMGAHGERRFGAARGCRDFIYVKASHGIGAALVLNGEVYRGATGAAGEIGHVQLAGARGLCRCGNLGCLETVVSITEVHREFDELRLPGLAYRAGGSLAAISVNPVAARIITEAAGSSVASSPICAPSSTRPPLSSAVSWGPAANLF